MLKPYEMLDVLINNPSFNFNQEFIFIKEFSELNEDVIGGVFKEHEFVIGKSYEDSTVCGMLIRKLKTYDGVDTIQDTKICGQKADAIYALTNMSGEVYYFLTWFVAK